MGIVDGDARADRDDLEGALLDGNASCMGEKQEYAPMAPLHWVPAFSR